LVTINNHTLVNICYIGTPEEISVKEVARKVLEYFGREVKIVSRQLQLGSTQRRCPDITKLKKLGFVQNIPFEKDCR
jgi:nucleoside-diphosphate-sugar epimerase